MKKVFLILVALVAELSLSASEPAVMKAERKVDGRNKYTNMLEKVPLEGSYVGYAGIEMLSPSYFGDGGTNFGVTTSHGVMITNRIFVGGGAGYIHDFRNDIGIIPVFAEGRYFFQSQYQRRIYPHIGARAGAIIPTQSQAKAGYLLQVCLGFRVPLTEGFAFNLEVGPQYATKYSRDTPDKQIAQMGEPFISKGDFFSFFARVNFEF